MDEKDIIKLALGNLQLSRVEINSVIDYAKQLTTAEKVSAERMTAELMIDEGSHNAKLYINAAKDQLKYLLAQHQEQEQEQEPDYWLGYGLQAHTEKPFEGATPVWTKPQPKKPEQEPVAWMVTSEMQDGTKNTYPLTGRYKDIADACDFGDPIPLYASPPQHTWQGLTDEELRQAAQAMDAEPLAEGWQELNKFARAIEAALKDRNK